ncbi:hypothetical protein L3C95_30300 [Chitinophaga filiformis]|uniref:glycine-rich domain-containing protein n=1 Tax=Chitinophaga filiformis TaxID=104663 RepID=UPI001F401E38|nr:hypothetical protein [Chitinophaga filiformis]MCF6407225.1 hypothetical protein [Chitinophaga filiformis]
MNQTTALTREEQALLWQRILSFPLDAPDARLPFSHRLARENKWNYNFGLKAIEEYRKFIFLCCISPQGASPSKVIDEVWHLHLIYTQNYWEEFCGKTLNRNIHHHPSAGGQQERNKHGNWRADTLDLYRNTFHTEPPPEYWDDKHSSTNPLSRFLKRFILPTLPLPFFFLTACNETSTSFFPIAIGCMIALGSIIAGSRGNNTEEKRKKNDSDGSSGSSCGSSCSSGCGSGCGGGCGGCGS